MAQLVACPECKKHLQVPDELLGKKVQCPECKHTFTASADAEPAPEEKHKTGTTTSVPAKTKTKKPAWEDPEKNDDDDEDSDVKKKKKKTKRRDPDDDDDDDDDDNDDRPRRSKRRRSMSRNYAPHRGGMIMAFGLIALIGGLVLGGWPFLFGIVAWIMGNNDLAEMRAGRMDPEGESQTQTGRICGMISTILAIVGVVITCGFLVVWFICMMGIFGAAAGAGANMPPPNRRGF